MDPAQIAALGAFMSGLGSVVSAVLAARVARKRASSDCDDKIQAMRDSFDRGMTVELRHE